MARALNESEQAINNWETRKTGISAQGCITVQKRLGISASWLQDGEGAMFVQATESSKNEVAPPPQLTGKGSPESRKLIEAILAADANGLSVDAFNALREVLRLFARQEPLPDWTAGAEDPPL
ncbi:hypothetical protein BLA3211_08408 [Burkholderia aenigmatica]|uniref:HTH cro/C1-type domain-containing protein n=2 Tax=Burkholderia aenigmatica TaxID=2015348 RepID=A0A6J5JTG3_9BURK|nr:hypothetical protein BLA3211_08408 [Burkholderia aenigmatica]